MKKPTRRPGNRSTRDGNFGLIDPSMVKPSDKHGRPAWMVDPSRLPKRPPSPATRQP